MTGALIILCVTVAVGFLLFVSDRKYRRKTSEENPDNSPNPDHHGEICCGQHLICEKPYLPKPGEEIVYYDDEELDRFAGREADGYTDDEIAEIRDVMETLLPEDVAGWCRSITLRGINLPVALRDELLLLINNE